jgi:hypothetical protein
MPQLTDLDVEWVSLVDRAAVRDPVEQSEPNRFLIWKRDQSQGGHPMSNLTKELLAQLGDPVEKEDALGKLVERAEDSDTAALAVSGAARLLHTVKSDLTPEALAEVVKAAGLELPEPEAQVFKAENAAEVVKALKGADVPEAVVKEVEEALATAAEKAELEKADLFPAVKAALAKAEEDRKEATRKAEEAERIAKEERDTRLNKEFVVKAEGFKGLTVEAAKFGPILKAASEKLDKSDFDELDRILKAADEQIVKGELFKEAGGHGPAPSDAFEEATRKAEELRKSDSSLTKEQALEKALDADSDLQSRYLAEMRSR